MQRHTKHTRLASALPSKWTYMSMNCGVVLVIHISSGPFIGEILLTGWSFRFSFQFSIPYKNYANQNCMRRMSKPKFIFAVVEMRRFDFESIAWICNLWNMVKPNEQTRQRLAQRINCVWWRKVASFFSESKMATPSKPRSDRSIIKIDSIWWNLCELCSMCISLPSALHARFSSLHCEPFECSF